MLYTAKIMVGDRLVYNRKFIKLYEAKNHLVDQLQNLDPFSFLADDPYMVAVITKSDVPSPIIRFDTGETHVKDRE